MLSMDQPPATQSAAGNAWSSFWAIVWRYDRTKISFPVSIRNAVGVALPLVAGLAVGHLRAGIVIATGALNVSYSDGADVHSERARRLLLASVFVGLAVLAGSLTARTPILSVLVAGVAAFAAGELVAFGQTAADLGTISLVTLVVYSAQPLDPSDAMVAGLLALLGGLLQSGLSLASWPVRRYQPLRLAIGALYRALAEAERKPVNVREAPPATAQSTAAQETIARYGVDHSSEAERYRSLLNQGERIRLSLLALGRLRRRLEREWENGHTAAGPPLESLNNFLGKTAALLEGIGETLSQTAKTPAVSLPSALPTTMNVFEAKAESDLTAFGMALVDDIRYQTEALGGQLRAALELTHGGSGESDAAPGLDSLPTFRERLSNVLITLRANLNLQSAACRHALRLSVAVALSETLGRFFEVHRFYWLPMTVAIILKPDFSTTYSRGILRLGGTLLGLVVATLLNRLFVPSPWLDIAFVALFVSILRSFGAANYGVFTTAISALIVYLFALSGVAPKEVVAARALNSVAGGALALLVYWVWPTWEDARLSDRFAAMLETYRDYFAAIAAAYQVHHLEADRAPHEIDRQRLAARLVRTNLEASVLRYSAEPRVAKDRLRAISGMMASSHRLVHAVMSLEAGLGRTVNVQARPAFANFAGAVTKTLTYLAMQWRGTSVTQREFPDLRRAHRELVGQGTEAVDRYALVNIETDRITNSLNTLAEQVRDWQGRGVEPGSASYPPPPSGSGRGR